MKKAIVVWMFLVMGVAAMAQKTTLDPTITPSLFRYNEQITVTYDVTGTALASLPNAWIWVWVPNSSFVAKFNVNPASTDVVKSNNAKFTKTVNNGKTLFTISFKPSDFFEGSIATATTLGVLLKGNDWSNGQTTDFVATIWDGTFQVSLTSPVQRPLFVENGEQFLISAETPTEADFDLFVNDALVTEQNGTKNFSYNHTVAQAAGGSTVRLVATAGGNTAEKSFQYIISAPSPVMARPAGIIPGINHNYADNTRITLCVWAPGKTSAYLVGDFTDWDVRAEYVMKKDGEYFWYEVTGLDPGFEYAFQYLLDETVFIADPYSDMILDPDDQYIPDAVYPNLKPFPEKAFKDDWYFNRLSVFKTIVVGEGRKKETKFVKPPKESLVIYELLIRDFFGNGERTYENLLDTLSYLKRLGVNAIELMPIMEFNGNESWGYNPTFMFAPDKYYGPKEKFMAFVDHCHDNGIAVILDIALNHQDIPNSYLMQDFNFATFKPNPTNRWFNVDAKHPFNVFFDMNHESAYTKAYLDTINHYWLNEFQVDGFRFDLSKGFTQVNNPNNVEAWSNYDASRIAILKRMADKIWSHTPDAYIILEHLSVNLEEKELAEYRANEGKGMMLWGKMTDQYNQNTMGFASSSDISGVYHGARSWTTHGLVGYMESHDEERLMVKNLSFGAMSGSYSVRDPNTALARQMAAATVFYPVPGPKMQWQFGELGYDYSINYCPNGTISTDCRISNKPVRWDYYGEPARRTLYDHTAELIKLKQQYDVFASGTAEFFGGGTLNKRITIKNTPYNANPTSTDDMNAVVVANFDLTVKEIAVEFPHTGTWYSYYGGGAEIQVTGATHNVTLIAGGFALYTDVAITPSAIVGTEETALAEDIAVFPNPSTGIISIESKDAIRDVKFYNMSGMAVNARQVDKQSWDVHDLPHGFYLVRIATRTGFATKKLIKR